MTETRIKELAAEFAVRIVAEKEQPVPYRGSIERLIRTVAAEAREEGMKEVKRLKDCLQHVTGNYAPYEREKARADEAEADTRRLQEQVRKLEEALKEALSRIKEYLILEGTATHHTEDLQNVYDMGKQALQHKEGE